MNRRSFLKRLGAIAGVAVVAPLSLFVESKRGIITKGKVSKNIRINSEASRRWAKAMWADAQKECLFRKADNPLFRGEMGIFTNDVRIHTH